MNILLRLFDIIIIHLGDTSAVFCENLYANMIYQVAQLAQYIHRKKTTVKHVRRFKVIADSVSHLLIHLSYSFSMPLIIFHYNCALRHLLMPHRLSCASWMHIRPILKRTHINSVCARQRYHKSVEYPPNLQERWIDIDNFISCKVAKCHPLAQMSPNVLCRPRHTNGTARRHKKCQRAVSHVKNTINSQACLPAQANQSHFT